MKRRPYSLAIAAAVAALIAATVPAMASPADPIGVSAMGQPSFERPTIARGLIVKAKTTSEARRTSIARRVQSQLPGRAVVASTKAGPAGLSILRFDVPLPTSELDSAIAELRERADVQWAVPDTLRFAQSAPPVNVSDPSFTTQGNLWDTRDAIDGVATVGGFTTKAPALWRSTRGKSSVVVAVVDTGITSHPDLAGQTVPGYDFVDDEYTCFSESECYYDETYVNAGDGNGWDANPADPGDWLDPELVEGCFPGAGIEVPSDFLIPSSWHGTHVSGTVAAKANNGIGVAGVAPGVKVQPVRALGHCGGYDTDILHAILWASGDDLRELGVPLNTMPADVINLSLGGQAETPEEAQEYCEFYTLVAESARARGATLVASAGNDSASQVAPLALSVPATCAGYVSVTATSDTGHRAWYSTGGSSADIAAPGGDAHMTGSMGAIESTLNLGQTVPQAPGYARYHGTSMAAPAAAAGAALLYSLGITKPASVEAALKKAVQPFSTVSKGPQTITVDGESLTTASLDCAGVCGSGILDLSKVTAPLGAPVLTGSRHPGGVLKASSRGLTNTGGASAITWWRGSTRVGSGSSHRITAADLGRTLTARDTVVSGHFAGVFLSASVAVPKATSRATISMPRKVKKSKRAKLKVKIAVPLARPTGKIRVFDGKKRIKVVQIRAKDNGTVKITLPKLKRKGKHRIRVVYSGDSRVTGAKSKVKVVRVG